MAYGLYISAEGALAQSQRMETISNNLANADTAGFKRDLALFQARFAEETERGLDFPGSRSVNDIGGGVMTAETRTDYSVGPLKPTNLPTDMALPGAGFFMVRRGDEDLLTRAGNFARMPDGALVNQDGYPVLNSEGTPIIIDEQAGPWQITENGGIAQAGTVNYLAIVEPASLGDLSKAGDSLFRPLGPVKPMEDAARRVAPGYLEASGVRPTSEMMQMIQTSRAFEANVNMIKHQDTMLGTLIGRVLKQG